MSSERFAEEQAALRRVATLVARAASPDEMFSAVAAEVGGVLSADLTTLSRYYPDGAGTVVGTWSKPGAALPIPAGLRLERGGRNLQTLVFQTGRPARIDDYADASGPVADVARERGIRSAVGAPISVEGRLWGFMSAMSIREEHLPADTEARLAGFTELVATAIANAQARVDLRGTAEEQAALRRVATLVARAAPPGEVFHAVSAEAGRLLSADLNALLRFDPDGMATVLGTWSRPGVEPGAAVGVRFQLGGRNATSLVFQTGEPARMDDYADGSGALADSARDLGVRASAGVPVSVEGRLWGIMIVTSRGEPIPVGTEARLAGFTELVATAIANAEARAALTASRARIVAAADAARRRIERDLHDGAQQRFVHTIVTLKLARRALADVGGEGPELVGEALENAQRATEELRELARGIHPSILTSRGLGPALEALARRSNIPVTLELPTDARLPEHVEVTAYFVVSEALTNAAKHAHASCVQITIDTADGEARLSISDDGVGGADPTRGSGLAGLKDRVEAIGGTLTVQSRPGQGTRLIAEVPVNADRERSSS